LDVAQGSSYKGTDKLNAASVQKVIKFPGKSGSFLVKRLRLVSQTHADMEESARPWMRNILIATVKELDIEATNVSTDSSLYQFSRNCAPILRLELFIFWLIHRNK